MLQNTMQAMAGGLAVISTPPGSIREAAVDNVTSLPAAAWSAYVCENFGGDVMLDRMENVSRRMSKERL